MRRPTFGLQLASGTIVLMNTQEMPSETTESQNTTPARTRSSRVQKRMDSTRKAIVDAALALFDRIPYRDVTIRMIMGEAGFGTGTFYNFFSDKEDLVMYAARELMANAGSFLALSACGDTMSERIEAMMRGAATFIAENASMVNLFMTAVAQLPDVANVHGSRHATASIEFTKQLIEQGQATGEFRACIDARVAAELLQNCLGTPREVPKDATAKQAFIDNAMAKTSLVLDALRS